MAIQLSPGVNVTEVDLTTVVPTVATAVGAIAGLFQWGPVGKRVLVDTEDNLIKYFSKPTNYNAETWFTAANFLSYNNSLYVSRAANTTGATPRVLVNTVAGNASYVTNAAGGDFTSTIFPGMYLVQSSNSSVIVPKPDKPITVTSVNATAIMLSQAVLVNTVVANTILHFAYPATSFNGLAIDGTNYGTGNYYANSDYVSSKTGTNASRSIVTNLSGQIVANENDFLSKNGNFDPDVLYIARYPGKQGSSLRVSVCDSSNAFTSTVTGTNSTTYGTALINNSTSFSINGGGYLCVELGDSFASAAGFSNLTAAAAYASQFSVGDKILVGNNTVGYQQLVVDSVVVSTNTVTNPLMVGTSNTAQTANVSLVANSSLVNNAIGFMQCNNIFSNNDVVFYANNDTKTALSIVGNPYNNTAITTLQKQTDYYIVNANTSGFAVSLTPAGNPILVQGAADRECTFIASNNQVLINFTEPYKLHTPTYLDTVTKSWEFKDVVQAAPGQSNYVRMYGNSAAQDELHVVVVDDDGLFTGTPGSILEVYKNLSRATDAKNIDGSSAYYKEVINQSSAYVWVANDRYICPSANALFVTNPNQTTNSAVWGTKPLNIKMSFAQDGYNEAHANSFSSIAAAYDLFKSPEEVDISLVLTGRPLGGVTTVNGQTVTNFQIANYVIDNICETRKDCVAFVSPDKSLIINSINNSTTGREASNLVNWRGAIRSTSYAVMDGSYKYQYDRYNDVYRWIPLNGDIAGLCARTDHTNDAWWSPAGFNRGQIKNIIRLGYNPTQSERDLIYVNGINPVVTFPGKGTVLYGDKTLQGKPSAFDRINVRRLFIVLEKAISAASKYSLFEFNDPFTRSQFKNLVTPYLRQIQGRRGITDFHVVCDETNNTAQVIDSNQFVGDIYIKPARSINFIQLNFVAVGTGVQFSEVVGKF